MVTFDFKSLNYFVEYFVSFFTHVSSKLAIACPTIGKRGFATGRVPPVIWGSLHAKLCKMYM